MIESNLMPALKTKSDNRRYIRLVKSLPVNFSVYHEHYSTVTHDIGIGGVSFNANIENKNVLNALLSKRKALHIKIRLLEEDYDLYSRADIAWIYQLKIFPQRVHYGLGVKFIDLNEKEKNIVSSYIKQMISLNHRQSMKNRQKIRQVIAQIMRIPENSFSENSLIRQELDVDSLLAMEALQALEILFGIEIDESRAFNLLTVGDLMDMIEEYIKK
ncbi:MAG: phosphopantetheine-binding protein [bacterium]